MPTASSVKLVECPRDAWQGLKGQIPAYIKIDYLKALISAGFKHIDAASFVSPKAVPQMADSDEVMKDLDPPDDVEVIGVVVNEKGAERAIQTQAVRTLGFPYSISPTFLENNQRQTLEDAIEELEKIGKRAGDAGLETIVYVSMAFGNPYGDLWNMAELTEAVGLLESENIHTISLADTVGLATPQQIRGVVSAVLDQYGYLEIGVHRRFDSAIGGLGGCPFAQDALVGNIATENLLEALTRRGVEPPIKRSLDALQKATAGIQAKFSEAPAAD